MNKRVWFLAFLVGAAVLCRGFSTYQVLFRSTSLMATMGLAPEVKNTHFTIERVTERDPSGQPTPAVRAGLKKGDEILAVYNERGEGRAIDGFFDVGEVLRTIRRGESFTLVLRRNVGSGQSQDLHVIMQPAARTWPGWLFLIGVILVLPALAIGTACFIGFLRPQDNNAFTASLLFLCFSTIFGNDYYMFPSGLREFALVFLNTLNAFLTYLL